MARVSVKVPASSLPAQQPAAPPVAQSAPPTKSGLNPKLLLSLIVGLLIILLVVVIVLLSDRNHLQNQVNKLSTGSSSSASSSNDAEKYQAEISKFAELPTGQKPSLVPVSDVSKLAAENPFFKNAKNGDVVLLYLLKDKSVTAVLYRPSDHKVVELTSSATIGGSDSATNSSTNASGQ